MPKSKSWPDAILLPLQSLIFCPWNCNEMEDAEFAELVSEIEDGGFDEPLQVIEITARHTNADDYPEVSKVAERGKYLVLGGEHRARAATTLEWSEAPVIVKEALADAPESELIQWSVKRNNIRGRINAQRYAEIERTLSERHQLRLDAVRRKMLIKGETLKRLRKNIAVQDNEGIEADNEKTTSPQKGKSNSERDEDIADRRSLLNALKTAEQDVLLQSADTVEHGYLFFAQGDQGTIHLVVDESPKLFDLVRRMVAACKGDSARVDEFLADAITAELAHWEDR